MSQLFINPVELLGLESTPMAALDGAMVRKARTRLRHELQLSDAGTIAYHGQQLDQSAVEMACADLDNPVRLRLWYRLVHMPALNTFLATGQSADLAAGNAEYNGSLTADAELLALIGPRYAEQYDRALTSAFQAQDSVLLRRLAALPLLFKLTQQAAATRTVGRQLREATAECERLTEQLDESDNAARVVLALRKALAQAGWSAALAALPALLTGPRTALVLAVRNYAIALFNTVGDPASAALQLLREAATVPTDAQTLDRVREDSRQIEEIEHKRQQRSQQQALVQQFNEATKQGLAYQQQAGAGTVTPTTLTQWCSSLTPLITELNAQTEEAAAEARTALANVLANISAANWEKSRNGPVALQLVAQALTLQGDADTKGSILAYQRKLQREVSAATPPRTTSPPAFPPPTSPRPLAKPTSGVPAWVWLAAIGLVLFLLIKCNDWPTIGPATSAPEQPVSAYVGNQLPTGASPFDRCFGKGKYSGPCWVQFDNSANTTDVVICLVNARTGRTIRNEYIRAGATFKMTQVPRGSYYTKGVYGKDWNPTQRNVCGTKGCFDKDQSFSASPSDAFKLINDARGYSTHTITLYGVAGNASQEQLSAAQFFQITRPF